MPNSEAHRNKEMINEDNKIVFTTEDGEEVTFFIEEETRINGTAYILVSDSDDDEANAYIFKDISADGDDLAEYVEVEDQEEFDAVAGIFRQMMDDVDIQ